jgi:hypothetical protein
MARDSPQADRLLFDPVITWPLGTDCRRPGQKLCAVRVHPMTDFPGQTSEGAAV